VSPHREPLHPRPARRHQQGRARPSDTEQTTAAPDRAPLPTDAAALPPLPDVFWTTLRSGLPAIDASLDQAQLDALDAYVRLLLAWTAAINLTAIRDPEAVARDHLLDSLAAVPLLRDDAGRVADLGSGGGLPGIPLAVALPSTRFVLVESVGKKARFLATAVAALGLDDRVTVAAERAEDLAAPDRERERLDVVTVRAVAALPELIELALPLLRVDGRLIAWKREPFEPELAAGRNAGRALGAEIEVVEVTAPSLEDRRLVVVTKGRPTPRRYPRSPADRRARPL
jgi:16S rRNA (guanine527-N7)-methyltransferase